MSTASMMKREELCRFVNYWDKLFQMVPEARREAVEAAGEAIRQSLNAHIQSADLSGGEAKGRVKSWQELRLGSGGGWAALSPRKGTVYSFDRRAGYGGRYRQHTWNGRPVTARQVTTWLERGHGTGRRGKERWGSGYVAGRQFYAWTRDDAQELALKAADRVLCRIADEVDF